MSTGRPGGTRKTQLCHRPQDLQDRLRPGAERAGFVPNFFKALGRRPNELRAFLDYHDALMNSDDGLSKAERELVIVATSAMNRCVYCVVAHGAVLRVRSREPELADHVGIDPHSCELEPRQRAIVDFGLKISQDPAGLSEEDFSTARRAGLSDEELWDIGSIAALFGASRRLAHLFALQPNPEFFSMGR